MTPIVTTENIEGDLTVGPGILGGMESFGRIRVRVEPGEISVICDNEHNVYEGQRTFDEAYGAVRVYTLWSSDESAIKIDPESVAKAIEEKMGDDLRRLLAGFETGNNANGNRVGILTDDAADADESLSVLEDEFEAGDFGKPLAAWDIGEWLAHETVGNLLTEQTDGLGWTAGQVGAAARDPEAFDDRIAKAAAAIEAMADAEGVHLKGDPEDWIREGLQDHRPEEPG